MFIPTDPPAPGVVPHGAWMSAKQEREELQPPCPLWGRAGCPLLTRASAASTSSPCASVALSSGFTLDPPEQGKPVAKMRKVGSKAQWLAGAHAAEDGRPGAHCPWEAWFRGCPSPVPAPYPGPSLPDTAHHHQPSGLWFANCSFQTRAGGPGPGLEPTACTTIRPAHPAPSRASSLSPR